jgi:hypothetical protein
VSDRLSRGSRWGRRTSGPGFSLATSSNVRAAQVGERANNCRRGRWGPPIPWGGPVPADLGCGGTPSDALALGASGSHREYRRNTPHGVSVVGHAGRCEGERESGRLDLYQRPFGPSRTRIGRARWPTRRRMTQAGEPVKPGVPPPNRLAPVRGGGAGSDKRPSHSSGCRDGRRVVDEPATSAGSHSEAASGISLVIAGLFWPLAAALCTRCGPARGLSAHRSDAPLALRCAAPPRASRSPRRHLCPTSARGRKRALPACGRFLHLLQY